MTLQKNRFSALVFLLATADEPKQLSNPALPSSDNYNSKVGCLFAVYSAPVFGGVQESGWPRLLGCTVQTRV